MSPVMAHRSACGADLPQAAPSDCVPPIRSPGIGDRAWRGLSRAGDSFRGSAMAMLLYGLDQTGDNAPTSKRLIRRVYRYFRNEFDLGFVMDPCAGDGRLFTYLLPPRAWCEVQRGHD